MDARHKHHAKVGAIVGGVIGGLAAIVLLGIGLWYFRFRREDRESAGDWSVDGMTGESSLLQSCQLLLEILKPIILGTHMKTDSGLDEKELPSWPQEAQTIPQEMISTMPGQLAIFCFRALPQKFNIFYYRIGMDDPASCRRAGVPTMGGGTPSGDSPSGDDAASGDFNHTRSVCHRRQVVYVLIPDLQTPVPSRNGSSRYGPKEGLRHWQVVILSADTRTSRLLMLA